MRNCKGVRVEREFWLADIMPSPIYRVFSWLWERPRAIKWWFQRANGKLPECDCWEYKDTLVLNIRQGLEYLLREDGATNWEVNREHKKRKEDLEFIVAWTYLYFETRNELFKAIDDENLDEYRARWKEYESVQAKAFRLLNKYLQDLWD